MTFSYYSFIQYYQNNNSNLSRVKYLVLLRGRYPDCEATCPCKGYPQGKQSFRFLSILVRNLFSKMGEVPARSELC